MDINGSSEAAQVAKRSTVVKVLHWGDSPPSIVCLIGPMKHRTDVSSAFLALSLAGHIVLMPPTFGPPDAGFISGDTKKNLDKLQFRMIDMCDIVYVVSPNGYMEQSMKDAASYAEKLGRTVKYLNS